MIKKIFFIACFLCIYAVNAQEKALIEFENEKVTKSEFIRIYQKNNSGEMVRKSTVDEYLELYINFKLKVMEAKDKGLDTLSLFKRELAGYRAQLARPYLSTETIMEELKQEAYARMKEEVRASHLLILAKEDASPEDTLAAYKKITSIRDQIVKGADFAEMARKHSQDPNATKDGGDLGYFTAFHMVYPFESAAFKTEVGEVSKVIRTRFGYHILKVADKRPSRGSMDAAHILVSTDPSISKASDPKAKVDEIYRKLKNGDDFGDMAKQFSDDAQSARRGGRLPTFRVGKMVSEFEDAAFALEKNGDITEPVQSQYGWHIIKRIKYYPLASYEKMEGEIINSIERDSRAGITEKALLSRIKKQYGFTENEKSLEEFVPLIDTAFFKGSWKKERAAKLKKTLFEIGDKEVTQQDFAMFLERTQMKRPKIDPRILLEERKYVFVQRELLRYKDAKLDEEYPEFADLMHEYHDGILLFNLTEQEIWNKASQDTLGLQNFYKVNKEQFKWEQRAEATLYSALNIEVVDQAKKMIEAGVEEQLLTDSINSSSQLNLNYRMGKYEKGDNELMDQMEWKEGLSATIEKDGRFHFAEVKKILDPSYKTLDDSRGLITSEYQDHLEKEWINALRKKYAFNVNQKVLESVKSELN